MIKCSRPKSTARKPLFDISNSGKPSRVSKKKKSPIDDVMDGGAFDRLLLVRFELSNLFGQIDELIAQAVENRKMDRKATQHIESFRNVLSDMHSSLKPWVSRLRQAFSCTLASGENQFCPVEDPKSISRADIIEEGNAFSLKNETELDFKVSPSPLVTWRAGTCAGVCALDTGKQLFLLTPLPKSKVASCKSTVKMLGDKNRHAALELAQNASDNLFKTTKVEIPPANVPKPCIVETNNKVSECGAKTSPPPASSALPGNNDSKGFVDLSDDAWNDMTSRYQELLGLNPSNNFTNRRNEVSLTLDWFLSPPKTCVIMEPTDEKPVPTPADNGILFLATPLLKNLESTVRKGKRMGESTLKKELWNRFDEASKDGLHFDASVFQKTRPKGFLDMLEEACEAE